MDGEGLIRTIFVSGRSERFCTADFRAIERRLSSALGSARSSTGCGGFTRRAAWRRARWADTSRRRSATGTRPFCPRRIPARSLHAARAGGGTRRARAQGRLSLGVEFRPRGEAQFQKKASWRASANGPTSREGGRNGKKRQDQIEPERLVFIDETWTKTNMEPLRGWAPRGERLVASAPHGHWKTMTFVAALRCDRIEAPWLLDGPINGEAFKTYLEKVLAPTLKPGDLVIMDNLGSHKGGAIRRAIRAARAKLFFLPKYSPDLNPIEQVFAKLKHLLRKAAARTIETLTAAVGELLGAYTAEECANYFTNAGYQA